MVPRSQCEFNLNNDFVFCIVFLRWMCGISGKIGVKAFDLILERQHVHLGQVKCFSDEELIKICTTMTLESEQVKNHDHLYRKFG